MYEFYFMYIGLPYSAWASLYQVQTVSIEARKGVISQQLGLQMIVS